MKKLIAIGIAVLMVLAVSTLSHADPKQTSKTINVLLGVDSDFGFQIWDTEYSQTLPNVMPGYGETGDIHFYITSNHSLPWYLNAASDGLTGETQAVPDTLPVKFSTYDGGGNPVPLTGTTVTDLVLISTGQHIYSAGLGEYPCAGLQVSGIFAVVSQTTTKQDLYSGSIVLTMTE